MNDSQPPLPDPSSPCRKFLVGRDSRGNWVAQDQQGLCGGLFIGRAEALRFALFEADNHPEAIIFVPGVFELDMTASAARTSGPTLSSAALQRAA